MPVKPMKPGRASPCPATLNTTGARGMSITTTFKNTHLITLDEIGEMFPAHGKFNTELNELRAAKVERDALREAIKAYHMAVIVRNITAYPHPDDRIAMAKRIDETQEALFSLIRPRPNRKRLS